MNYESMSTEELLLLRDKTEMDLSKYNNFQLCRKINLNSCYGAVG